MRPQNAFAFGITVGSVQFKKNRTMRQVSKVIELLLIVVCYHEHWVGCDRYQDRVMNVNLMSIGLKQCFNKDLEIIFYDKCISESRILPLRMLSVLMAKSETVVYAAQRKGFYLAEDIIGRYFMRDTSLPSQVLYKHEYLVDLVVLRLIERSIEYGLYRIDSLMKHIYLILKAHHYEPGVLSLARKFFKIIVSTEVKESRARGDYARTLENYKALEQVVERNDSKVLTAIDQLIYAHERSLGIPETKAEDDQLVAKYVAPKLRKDLWLTELRLRSSVERYTERQIESIRLNDIISYQDRVLAAFEAVENYTIENRLEDWNRRLTSAMRTMFYAPKARALAHNAHIHAVIAHVGRILALAFAEERQMLMILKNLIRHEAESFARIFMPERSVIDIIEMRLDMYILEHGQLGRLDTNVQTLFRVFKKYDYIQSVRDLACKYFELVRTRRAKAETLMKQLTTRESQVPPEAIKDLALAQEIVAMAIRKWNHETNEMPLLENNINYKMLQDLISLKKLTYNRIHRPTKGEVHAVREEDVLEYERMVLRDRPTTELGGPSCFNANR